MSNHHRGLWGYYGETEAGDELTVQATGIGGPSAVVVLGELAELGLRRAIRVGTCTASGPLPPLGSRIVVSSARADDGCSLALGARAGEALAPDAGLRDALLRFTGGSAAEISSRDLHPPRRGSEDEDVMPTDLQTAATFVFCARSGIAAAATLAVASSPGRRLEDEPLEAALMDLAAAATAALAQTL